jgi:phage gp16-like protein
MDTVSTPARPPGWTKMLRAIHAACKAQGIDDGARHDLVHQITGHASLSDCSAAELGKVLNHLNRGRPRRQVYDGRARVRPPPSRADQLGKVDALLAELHRVTGKVHTLKYADAIAKKNGYGECVDFCDARGLRFVIAALTRTLRFKAEEGR